ncbi:MAG: response regulator [Oleiphilaceae bacterium]|nr:response regulator [Oleiphilaceae bacterium]
MISLNIMVVDDSPITIKKMRKLLEDLGHTVVQSCNTGKEAVECYAEVKPDLVTMDITMPDMDGITATKQIIAQDASALIMMVTSHGQQAMVLDAIKAGAKGYLLKPIKLENLRDSLNKVIDRYV